MAEKLQANVDCFHSRTQGRDRILKRIFKEANSFAIVIAIIDYESGDARRFIDEQFDLRKVEEGVFIGKAKRKENVFAVVFDPNIEEGLLQRLSPEKLRNPDIAKKLKSSEACRVIDRVVGEDQEAKKLLDKILNSLIGVITP